MNLYTKYYAASLQEPKFNLNVKVHFVHCYLDYIPDRLEVLSKEHDESFHQDLKIMEKSIRDVEMRT